MSASPMARQATENKSIPKRVVITDPMDMPVDYSSTPGGTLYSTTPGGSKIVYERSFLINLRNSPIAKTPPKWDIPESIMKGSSNNNKSYSNNHQHRPNHQVKKNNRSPLVSVGHDEDQFEMDM